MFGRGRVGQTNTSRSDPRGVGASGWPPSSPKDAGAVAWVETSVWTDEPEAARGVAFATFCGRPGLVEAGYNFPKLLTSMMNTDQFAAWTPPPLAPNYQGYCLPNCSLNSVTNTGNSACLSSCIGQIRRAAARSVSLYRSRLASGSWRRRRRRHTRRRNGSSKEHNSSRRGWLRRGRVLVWCCRFIGGSISGIEGNCYGRLPDIPLLASINLRREWDDARIDGSHCGCADRFRLHDD